MHKYNAFSGFLLVPWNLYGLNINGNCISYFHSSTFYKKLVYYIVRKEKLDVFRVDNIITHICSVVAPTMVQTTHILKLGRRNLYGQFILLDVIRPKLCMTSIAVIYEIRQFTFSHICINSFY